MGSNLFSNLGPLEVVCQKPPMSIGNTTTQTTALLSKILAHCGYRGRWEYKFNQQKTNRTHNRFRILDRRWDGIQLMTKPGDSGSCWKILLHCPKCYDIREVFENLNKIYVNDKCNVSWSDGTIPEDVPEIAEVKTEPVVVPPVEVAMKPAHERAREFLQKYLADGPQKITDIIAAGEKLGISASVLQKIRTAMRLKTEKKGFGGEGYGMWRLPDESESLAADEQVIDQATRILHSELINGSYVPTVTARTALLQQLDLSNFPHDISDPQGMATDIIEAVCKNGYFGKWEQEGKLKGYIITPAGMELASETPVVRMEQEPAQESPNVERFIEQNLDTIKPLFDEYSTASESLKQYDSIIDDLTAKRVETQREIEGIAEQIKTLQSTQESLASAQSRIDKEIAQYLDMQREDQEKYNDVRDRLQKLLAQRESA